ncbi:MAG TPA: hypothetical protein VGW12_14045 [Pyrinomonadaceae bacterium]|nr:hypothetical protein [Pyrinomonadaceae bacterium]
MDEPASAAAPDLVELQKTYSESVSRTSRFLVTTLIILAVLTFITELELREFRRDRRSLVKQKKSAAQDLNVARKELNASLLKINVFLDERRKGRDNVCSREDREDGLFEVGDYVATMELPVRAPARAGQSFPAEPRGYWPELPRNEIKHPYEFLCGTLDGVKDPALNINDKAGVDKLKGHVPEIRQAISNLESQREREGNKAGKKDEQLIEFLDEAVKLVRGYEKPYKVYTSVAEGVVATSDKLDALNSTKPSIPTPFGDFEVQPALALLGLSFATLLSYFAFISSIYKIRSYAIDYAAAHQWSETISGRDPAPFWLFSTDPDLKNALTWRAKPRVVAALSLTLHAGWVLLAAWLTWECLSNWNSIKFVPFDYKLLWPYALVALLLIAAGLAVSQFLPPQYRRVFSRLKLKKRPGTSVNRRVVLGGILATFGLAATGGLLYLLLREKKVKVRHFGLPATDATISPHIRNLVLHDRKLVLHHSEICSKHLPIHKHRARDVESRSDGHLHSACQLRILEKLAKDALHNLPTDYDPEDRKAKRAAFDKQAELALPYLEKAVLLSPFSYHLYDKLIGLYGRLRRYDAIKNLLEQARQNVERELAALNSKPKGRGRARGEKQLKRAQQEFETRLVRVRYYEENSKMKKTKTDA